MPFENFLWHIYLGFCFESGLTTYPTWPQVHSDPSASNSREQDYTMNHQTQMSTLLNTVAKTRVYSLFCFVFVFLCSPGCPQTQGPACLCLPSTGIKGYATTITTSYSLFLMFIFIYKSFYTDLISFVCACTSMCHSCVAEDGGKLRVDSLLSSRGSWAQLQPCLVPCAFTCQTVSYPGFCLSSSNKFVFLDADCQWRKQSHCAGVWTYSPGIVPNVAWYFSWRTQRAFESQLPWHPSHEFSSLLLGLLSPFLQVLTWLISTAESHRLRT